MSDLGRAAAASAHAAEKAEECAQAVLNDPRVSEGIRKTLDGTAETVEVDWQATPLDPSKVKAGDTVTLNIDPSPMEVPYRPYSVRGEVYPIGEALFAGGWPIIGHPSVTLTDHQPAPEPEPEQGFGTACVEGYGRIAGFYSRASGGSFVAPAPPGGYVVASGKDFSDFRPLVVIDPAAVDINALAAAIRKAEETGGPFTATTQRLAHAALVHLGIEAP